MTDGSHSTQDDEADASSANTGQPDVQQEQRHDEGTRKRKRGLRKGTHSCWACKRRKEKCTFDEGDTCTGCQRRGTDCVSQQFADREDTQRSSTAAITSTRLQRIEDMIAGLAAQMRTQVPAYVNSLQTPESNASPCPGLSTTLPRSTHSASTPGGASSASIEAACPAMRLPGQIRKHNLSRTLHNSLPCPEDIHLLRKATRRLPILSTIHITTSYATVRQDGLQPSDGVLAEPPAPTSDPVLLAKYLLELSIFLQEMQPSVYPELQSLAEPAGILSERCATTAIMLVTRQDDLLGSIESLQATVLESVYQCNSGRLKLSWMAAQRATLLARSMRLDVPRGAVNRREPLRFLDPNGPRIDLPNLWFNVVHYDLQLSRVLCLPASVDVMGQVTLPLYDAATNTPEGYMERVYHHIIARTQRTCPGTRPPDIEAIQVLYQEMQRAANSVPAQWWLPPSLAVRSAKTSLDMFWDMRRLVIQMLHHDLRNQLHVPLMLAKRGEGTTRQRCEMARLSCVNSSREILSRFILLRDCDWKVSTCQFPYFLGLMAAITLVIAHLGGCESPRSEDTDDISSHVDGLLSQEALSDRAMMEQALETMQLINASSKDDITLRCADVLRRLLDIEAKNRAHRSQQDESHLRAHAELDSDPGARHPLETAEHLFVPYFGLMWIVRPSGMESIRDQTSEVDNEYPRALPHDAYETDIAALSDDQMMGLSDDAWMSQNIDISFLNAFLDEAS